MHTSTPTRQEIAAAIRAARTVYINHRIAPSAFEINNGQCEDFAMDVINALTDGKGETDKLAMHWHDNFHLEHGVFDSGLLLGLGIQPPAGMTWADVDRIAGNVTHAFIACDGWYFDAECPDGVLSFFDLPVYRRLIIKERLRRVAEADMSKSLT